MKEGVNWSNNWDEVEEIKIMEMIIWYVIVEYNKDTNTRRNQVYCSIRPVWIDSISQLHSALVGIEPIVQLYGLPVGIGPIPLLYEPSVTIGPISNHTVLR